MNNLISTYRIQFNKDFTFNHLDLLLPYLKQLGISTIYASPIFEAVPGSTHGYDAINPVAINPELGTEEELLALDKKLKALDMQWLQDIVPNHMAFDHRNQWLMDVLEKGQQSMYASHFDISWNSTLYCGQVMVPFLGSALDEVIQKGELKIAYKENRFVFAYFESYYPLHLHSYIRIFSSIENANEAITQLLQQLHQIHETEEPHIFSERWHEFQLQLAALLKNDDVQATVTKAIKLINLDPQQLLEVAHEQVYRLCHWQETDHRINYRRFFTVNGLICLNIQNKEVLEQHHALINTLLKKGVFSGLRVDHIDGLYDPSEYLQQLRQMAGEDAYIIVEKILEPHEDLPRQWPIEGNSGYDFLSIVNNLFTNKPAEKDFTHFYQHLVNNKKPIHQQLHDKKNFILYNHMAGELDNLYGFFLQQNLVNNRNLSAIHPEDLKNTIAEFLIQCPVYRFYGNKFPLSPEEAKAVREIINHIKKTTDAPEAVEILQQVLLKNPQHGNEEYNQKVAEFYQRCMQFTGPLMAKGVEDTLMYTYNRFIGHNEVGDSPESFGISIDEFHKLMKERQQYWPFSLNATSTHDTKRGEDARARLNVVTDLHDEWLAHVKEWRQMNKEIKVYEGPDANDEYFIYQSIAASYPMPGADEDNFAERIQEYLQKALREAKTHSNWTTPNEEYEAAAKKFAADLLNKESAFWKNFTPFFSTIAEHGLINSLSQVILKFTCPGIPDVYQGCELWDFSFVDPDNRRPVDFEKRQEFLNAFENKNIERVWSDRYDGQMKLWLIEKLAGLRKEYPLLFAEGDYTPLQVEGPYKDFVLAFARKHHKDAFIIAIPLHTALLCKQQQKQLHVIDWDHTHIVLPGELGANLKNILNEQFLPQQKHLQVQDLFSSLPFAVLSTQEPIDNERGAGILLHITSLPSSFGVGDMGPEAKAFINFLHRSKQKYWQVLPTNPTEGGQGHSPYSATSSRAGYPLLISPELLATDGLLPGVDLQQYHLPYSKIADFEEAEKNKAALTEIAYSTFKKQDAYIEAFEKFCVQEKEWLDDFAFYSLLKEMHEGQPWYEWPDKYKLRKTAALAALAQQHQEALQKIKWLQYIFYKQWHELKKYCNSKNIQIIGDLPFYVSYDSADVWSHRHLFSLNEKGERTAMAGVPPDAFSADGQLWGMPVFNWEVMKEQQYAWWVDRVKKNKELFDLVRIDHFRAFSAYWEVPAGAETAKNGEWKPGPGNDFFNAIKKELGDLPFVAEDLGDIDDAVFLLRDAYQMPGMKVLQFAFGDDMPHSLYIPHNYTSNFLVYTGTHDNNTTKGWFRTEADAKMKKRINKYIGRKVTEEEVHDVFARLAYASVANIAILPLQDVLGLDESARMNTPASIKNNWSWRLTPHQINKQVEKQLLEWVWAYKRD